MKPKPLIEFEPSDCVSFYEKASDSDALLMDAAIEATVRHTDDVFFNRIVKGLLGRRKPEHRYEEAVKRVRECASFRRLTLAQQNRVNFFLNFPLHLLFVDWESQHSTEGSIGKTRRGSMRSLPSSSLRAVAGQS